MTADDGDSLGGRLGRYAKVGSSVGGLAVKLAGQRYLGWSLDRDKHASDLKAALGGLKGPLMKAAQLISTIPDALPPEYARELAQLQANAPAMGWAFVRRRMASELGPDWQSKFARFDKEAAFAASLGQVHRATLLDGTEIAAKLQYPDMASALEADLNQLKLDFRRSASASTRPSVPTRSTPRSPRACARSSTTGAKPGTWLSTATCCATNPTCMCRRSCSRTRPTGCWP